MFQFQIGAIKRRNRGMNQYYRPIGPFQFQIGAIKSLSYVTVLQA